MSPKLSLKYSHNIIDHLGLKLYQNKPTNVLAELVSNSYDADAENVNISLDDNEIFVIDDGLGMTHNDIVSKYLVIGKPKRKKDKLNETSLLKQRKFMGRKGIGKLAPFGIARKVSVITLSKTEQKINWFSINLDELLKETENSDGEIESYSPDIIIDNLTSLDEVKESLKQQFEIENKPKFDELIPLFDKFKDYVENSKSGTMIILNDLTVKRKVSDNVLLKSMGRRFTVTLLKNDFTLTINDEEISEKIALPEFEFRFPNEGYKEEIINVNGINRYVKHWCGFVGKAQWSQDESGVGIYAHGKIAQDRPFVFGSKGTEISTRYMYAVIEADWIDELPTELISTDRTSINWEEDETSDFYEWGKGLVRKWVNDFQKGKRDKIKDEIAKKLNRPDLPKITAVEKNSINEIVCGMSAKIINDDELQDEVIAKLTSAWLHEPSRSMINKLWDQLKNNENNHEEFIKILHDINEHLVPESLSVSMVTAQKIYALSKLHQLSANGIEEELQVLLEFFPWIINSDEKSYTSNQSLKEFAKKASIQEQLNAHGSTKVELKNQPDEGTRPDFAFFSTENDNDIIVVELKSPQVTLEHGNLNQLQTYMNWIKDRYTKSNVTGYLIGSNAQAIRNTDPSIRVMDWNTLCVESRHTYVEQLSALLKGASNIADPSRVVKIFEFAGIEAQELLRKMSRSNEDFNIFIQTVENEIARKKSRKGIEK